MFEVGIKRADNEYQRIYDEVMKLAQLGSKPIDLKVNFQSTRDLETFVNALKMVGDGKLLEPLLHRIEQLQVSMVKLGMIPRDINYNALEENLKKVSKAYENFQANLSKFGETHAVTTASKGVWQKELAGLQESFKMPESVAREALHTWKNFGDTIAANMERVGGSKAGMETLAVEINSVKVTVDNLVNSFSNLVREITNLGNANGKGVKETQMSLEGVDKETKTLANALATAIKKLSEQKEAAASGEKDLGAQTEITTNHLAAERAQALSTAEALNQLANHLTVAAIASKNLFTIMGGNNSDVTKFIELATQMDALSRKASYVLSSDASAFKGGKMGAFAEVKKEMDEVSARMDELKKNAAVGNPLVESFANAFNQLRETLEKANTAMSSAAASAKKLDNSVGGSKTGAEKLSAKFKSDDIEKLITAINTLNEAAKSLRQTLGTLSKSQSAKGTGDIAANAQAGADAIQKLTQAVTQQIEANNKLAQSEQKVADAKQSGSSSSTLFDTQKFNTLQEIIDKIISEINRLQQAFAQLGEGSSLSNLTAIIRNLEVTLGTFGDRLKLMPVDEQTKLLIEDNERLKQKLIEVGEAARYVNIQAGEKTQQKAARIAEIAGMGEVTGTVDKVTRSYNVAEQRINEFISRLKEAQVVSNDFADKGFDTTRIQGYVHQLLEVKKALDRIKENKGVHPEVFDADGMRKSISGQTSLQLLSETYVTGIEKNLRTELRYYKEIADEIERIERLRSKLSVLSGKIIDPSQQEQIRKTIDELGWLQALITRKNTSDNHALFGSDEYRENIARANSLIKVNTELIKENEAANRKAISAQERVSKNARTTAENLQSHIDKLEAKKLNFKGIDTSELDSAINKIRAIKNELESFATSGTSVYGNTAKDIVHNMNLAGVNEQAKVALQHLNNEKRNGAMANVQLTESEQRLANAISNSTDSMKSQSQVLSDLKMMAMQYLSVWGAQNVVNNIIEIGGQLEMQRLSIAAILGDMAHATDLFDKIKSLAIKSPFGVVELDQYTKQLSAYGFKYTELYDMTKRLADIAAGAGTDVSRLTLALGHVRAEGALSGYTLRQFAMNNIPMVGELAKKLSEVEGRMVSVAEVRKRVAKKEVGFDDVIDVIKKLTNEGGMFYNMQETVSESVKARFKNLKDSLDIMYGEVAESEIGDALKELAVQLTNITRNWKDLIPIMKSVVAVWGIYKVTTLAVNTTIGKNTAAVTENVIAYKKKRAAQLEQVSVVRKLTAEEQTLIATNNRLTASDIKALLASKTFTKEQALKLVALRKLSMEEVRSLVHMGAFTAAEARMAMSGKVLGMSLGKTGAMIKLFALSVKSSVASIVAAYAPMAALFGIMSVGMSVKQRRDEIGEERENRINSIKEQANEGYRNLQKAVNDYKVGASASLRGSDINMMIEEMMDKLREYSKTYNTTFNDAFKVDEQGHAVHNLAEQYEILAKSIEDAANAHKMYNEMRYMVEHALETSDNENGDSWWYLAGKKVAGLLGLETSGSDAAAIGNLKESLEYYAKAVQEANTAEQLFLRNKLDVASALEQVGHPEALQMSNDALLRLINTIKKDSTETFTKFYQLLDNDGKNSLNNMTVAWKNMESGLNAATLKMRKAGDDLYRSLVTKFETSDVTKWPSQWREFVMLAMDAATKDVKGFADMSEEYQNYVRDSFLKPFKITVDSADAKEQVNDLLVDLQNLVGKQWTIKIGVKGESAFEDAESAAKKWKEADEKVKTLEKRLERQGYKPGVYKTENKWIPGGFKNGKWVQGRYETVTTDVNSRAAQKNAEEYQEALAERNAAKHIYEAYGGDVSELQKDKEKEPKGGGKDKALEEVKERIRVIKEAADAFRYWRDKVGKDAAWTHVLNEFGDVLTKIGVSAENVENLRSNLRAIQTDPNSPYRNIKDKQKKLEVDKDIDKEIGKLGRNDFEKSSEEWASKMTVLIDDLSRKWEIFNSIVSSTGDRMLAARLSGISPGATPADLKRANVSSFAGVSIDFDRVLNMSGEQIDQYVNGLGVSEGKIKAVQNGLKDWKKAQEDLTKSDIQNYAKWLGSLVDLQSIQTRNQNEYNNALEETNRLLKDGLITEEEADRRRKAAKYEQTRRDWESSSMYSRLYNNSQVMAKGEFAVAYQNELVHLKMQLSNGTITVEQYADKVSKLNDIMRSFSTTGFLGIRGGVGALLSGGYQGLIDYHKGRANDLRKQGRNDEADAEEAQAISMTKAKNAADQITKAFQDVASGADMLSNMFKALGDQGTANFFSDASGVLGGVAGGAQALSGLGPWGMAAGAAIGGITSFAQLHDKHNQRLIEALQDDVKALEANTEMLKTSRSRTLGYDNGEIRKQMGEMYSRYNVRFDAFGGYDINSRYGAAGKAMAEFYGKGGNGYAKEFENLKKQRQDYIDMYNAERDKKDYSNAALEEYKQKIAELDDQIINFTEDLAKELWSIDIKGWGEQISDAIWTAFENGEDAAKAFHDTVKDIVADVAKKMMKLSVIEPMFKRLQSALFGTYDEEKNQYSGGAIEYDSNGNIDMANSQEKVLRILGQYFGTGGELEKSVEASETFYEWVKKITGIDFSDKESGLAGSTAIKGVTEQSFDLGLSYINSIRADVSINRAKIAEYFPMFYQTLTTSDTRLKNIEKSADAIMRSNDTIRDTLEDLFDDIHGLRTETWRMPMQ